MSEYPRLFRDWRLRLSASQTPDEETELLIASEAQNETPRQSIGRSQRRITGRRRKKFRKGGIKLSYLELRVGRRRFSSWRGFPVFDVEVGSEPDPELRTQLAALLGRIAEDLCGPPRPGDDEWSVEALIERRYDHRPLAACRQSRERETLLLLIDTSGFLRPYTKLFEQVGVIALRLGYIEVWDAPNASLHARLSYDHRREALLWTAAPQPHWPWRNRTIVFIGDSDGAEEICRASHHNRLYWFSPETHPQLPAGVEFHGRYFHLAAPNDLLRLLKEVRGL